MKITLKAGGREESRLVKLVSVGKFKNATDATETAINLLYQMYLAKDLAAFTHSSIGADVSLVTLQGLEVIDEKPKRVAQRARVNKKSKIVRKRTRI